MSQKVFIVILNWNGGKNTGDCIESLKSINYADCEILVVDNASKDSSPKAIANKFPGIKIIRNKTNLGFAGGMNVGIREAMEFNPEFILLLNQDVLVDKNFLTELVDKMQSDKKIGVIGPKIYFHSGAGAMPDKKLWAVGAEFVNARVWGSEVYMAGVVPIGCGEMDEGQYDNLNETDGMPGCCMLIKTEVIKKIGLLDERFFVFHEDDDYCIRIRRAGYKVCVAPKSVIWHKVSTSFRSKKELLDKDFWYIEENPQVIYYGYRNWLWVLRKHFPKKVVVRVFVMYALKLFLRQLWKLSKSKRLSLQLVYLHYSAFRDGILG